MSLEQILRFARRMKNADIPRTIRRDIFETSEKASNRPTYVNLSIDVFKKWPNV